MSTKFAKELLEVDAGLLVEVRDRSRDPGSPRSPAAEFVATSSKSPSSRTSTRTCTRSKQCSRRWTKAGSTSCGASATSSATGRSRTSASRSSKERVVDLPRGQSRSGRAREDLARDVRRRGRRRGRVDARGAGRARTCVSNDARSKRGHDRRGALSRQPTRSGVGLRAHRRRRAMDGRRHHRPARPRRPQPRRARARRGRHRGSRRPAAAGTTLDLGAARRLLNPGSVGQPRDGDPRAAWLEVDISAGRATFRRTDYPVERTQTEMRDLDLPEVLAARLNTACRSTPREMGLHG